MILFMDTIRRSQNSREFVLYSPYLVYNSTNLKMRFREHGLTADIEGLIIDESHFKKDNK